MSAVESPLNLVELIEVLDSQQQAYAEATEAVASTLRDQLRQHAEAAAAIAQTLEQVSGLLASLVGGLLPRNNPLARVAAKATGGSGESPAEAPARPAAPPPPAASAKGATAAKSGGNGARGNRGSAAATGTESVLGYIRENRNPTTADLAAHWKSEKRGGSVDNVLGQLVKAGTLKRQPNEQGRGSRYLLA